MGFACAPHCRPPAGTRAALVALAEGLRPRDLEVQVVVGRDALLRRLNRDFRGRDRATDVLSFLYAADGVGRRVGRGSRAADRGAPGAEVYVSMDRTAVQARTTGHSVAQEFVLLVLHGLLHVQGHDHHRAAETRRMRAAEVRALRRLAAARPALAARPMLTAGAAAAS